MFRRRTVLAGAGAGPLVLAACSRGASLDGTSGEVIVRTADVPVGSGVITGEVVVTQPVAGEYQGFSAICTHTGCLLNEVVNGRIHCPCHGSRFSLDGAVISGPAERPLQPIDVRVQGDSVVRA